MKPEKPVEIDRCITCHCSRQSSGARNRNRRTQAVVRLVAVRHHDVQCVSRAALKEADECLAFRRLRELSAERGSTQEARAQAHGYQRERARFYESSALHLIVSEIPESRVQVRRPEQLQ